MNLPIVSLSVLALGGILTACGGDDLASMKVAVQKKTGACWARMTGEPIDRDYPRSVLSCDDTGDPKLTAGVDRVSVVIDYGVTLEDGKTAPAPTLSVFLDGKDTSTAALVEPAVDGNTRFAYAEFLMPDTSASEMRIKISTPSGYAGGVSEVFEVVAATPTIALPQCSDETVPCSVIGGTSTDVTLSIPGSRTQTVTLESTINGQQDSAPLTVTLSNQDAGSVSGRQKLLVPFGNLDDQWQLTARFGGTVVRKDVAFTLPEVTTELNGCAQNCKASNGAATTLSITVPKDLRAVQAAVHESLDGVPDITPIQIALPSASGAAVTRTVSYLLNAPTSGNRWQLNVDVVGYSAQTIDVSLSPK